MNRRQFIETATLTVAAAATLPSVAAQAEEKAKRVNWPIGCFNRPWIAEKKNWGYDVALDGIKAAGYGLTGLLTRTANEPLLGSDATPDYLGKGKVDFPAVFGEMKRAGFNGPVMVECCAPGETPEAVTANARKNREYLEKLFATL